MPAAIPAYRSRLPQLDRELFLTDGGLETTLIFHEGIDLPLFAAVGLLGSDEGRIALRKYFDAYARLAAEHGVGIVLESATWRASPDWAAKLGYSPDELDRLNRAAIELLVDVRAAFATDTSPIVISGCIGPRGDGYVAGEQMSADEAEAYHAVQIGTFADTAADLVTAITMTYPDEALGIARAAAATGLPAVISFTVETDGRLPSGHSLAEAIGRLDEDESAPAYYMINCAHPTHFEHSLDAGAPWTARIRGLRANASTLSHAELDEAETLDDGDPDDLAARYVGLRERLPNLLVLGGCCGTDDRHVRAMSEAWPKS
jgi:S-methylmethionine-dependent homocysteine/selenocysteine methylase